MQQKKKDSKVTGKNGKKSKANYKCPPLLAEMIKDVNRLPKSTDQADKDQEICYVESYNYSKSIIGLIVDFPVFVQSNRKTIQKAFDKYFSPLGFDAKLHIDFITYQIQYLVSDGDYAELGLTAKQGSIYLFNWYKAYEAKNGEDSLNDFSKFYRTFPQIEAEAKNLKRIIRYKSVAKSRKTTTLQRIEIDADLTIDGTTVRIVKTRFFEAIENVDIDRLRVCETCGNYFWAARFEAKTCSKKCYNTFRQKQFRDKNRERLNENRRANYTYKKTLKKQ